MFVHEAFELFALLHGEIGLATVNKVMPAKGKDGAAVLLRPTDQTLWIALRFGQVLGRPVLI
jgi:hypothetical protein